MTERESQLKAELRAAVARETDLSKKLLLLQPEAAQWVSLGHCDFTPQIF